MTRGDGSEDPYSADVVAAVRRHMDEDHGDDSLLIVRGLGGAGAATAARMGGMDPDGIEFVATVGDAEQVVRVPWTTPPTQRRQVRAEVARMYRDACAALGLEPRGGEH